MQSVRTAFRVLESVAELQPVGVSEIARSLELPKSSAQRALVTLNDTGWIQRVEERGTTHWVLTTRALAVGGSASNNLIVSARRHLERLHVATRETVYFAIFDDELVLVEQLESKLPLRSVYPLGTHLALTATSAGKAVLASLPAAEATTHIKNGLKKYTPNSITSTRNLRNELDIVRTRGYALEHGEFTEGIHSVGVVVANYRAAPVAALGVLLPSSRSSGRRERELGQLLLKSAIELGEAPTQRRA